MWFLHPESGNTPHEDVRRQLIHFGVAVILTLCVWGHVSEIFDHWDNTFQTGNDIEYSTVIVVLIAGAVIGFARIAALVVRTASAPSYLLPLFYAHALAIRTPLPLSVIPHPNLSESDPVRSTRG